MDKTIKLMIDRKMHTMANPFNKISIIDNRQIYDEMVNKFKAMKKIKLTSEK